jgi:hypothetical protein
MLIFDFITQEEIDDLPDDDPQAAFTTFVRIAQRRLGERTNQIDTDNSDGWAALSDARHGFMNVVVAAAKKYEIEPLSSLPIPRLDEFNENAHRQFRADLDHYLTQLLLDNSSRAKRDSVLVSVELKKTIRVCLHELRDATAKDKSLSETKRSELLRQLEKFEAELDKKRLNLLAVTTLTITLLSAPGGIWASGELGTKLLNTIWRAVAEAKVADDESRRLPSNAPPMMITGPRKDDPGLAKKSELDDEIPF